MDKFLKFCPGIWEDKSETPNKIWVEKMKKSMKENIRQMEKLQITEQELGKTIKKRKTSQHL